jgi:hypothetical protein
MDLGGSEDLSDHGDQQEQQQKPRELPDDLPKSLNDRKQVHTDYVPETEMYDGWQGRLW